MGMYDYVICKRIMPDGFDATDGHRFQTKDFDCQMEPYTIAKKIRAKALSAKALRSKEKDDG